MKRFSQKFNHPGISELLESVILPSVQHESPQIRNSGIKCLGSHFITWSFLFSFTPFHCHYCCSFVGLYCLLDKDSAKRYISLFLKILAHDHVNIQLTAMHVLFDFVMLFGPNELGLCKSISSKQVHSSIKKLLFSPIQLNATQYSFFE